MLAEDSGGRYTVLEVSDGKVLEDNPHRESTQCKRMQYQLRSKKVMKFLDVVEDSLINQKNEQKEAEQMRVYWQVIEYPSYKGIILSHARFSLSKAFSPISARNLFRRSRVCSASRLAIIEHLNNSVPFSRP